MPISRPLRAAATMALVFGAGCGRATAPVQNSATATPSAAVPLSRLFVLEMTGPQADDTTVTFPAGTPRTIILRHGPPDNAPFVEVRFAAETFRGADAADSVTVTLRPRPGVYGVDFSSSVTPGPGGRVRFKYPIHFAAPVAAAARYGGPTRFERALSIARRVEGEDYRMLESSRPVADNLEAALADTGTYLVVAPR